MKKGVSPVIATVLLVAITVILAAAIFSFSKSTLESFSSPVNCDGISFEAGIVEDQLADSQKTLEINNQGEDLAGAIIKLYDSLTGSVEIIKVESDVLSGQSGQIPVDIAIQPAEGTDSDFGSYEFLIVPLIKKDRKTLVCTDESGVSADIQVITQVQPAPQCSDGIDNDGDELCDYQADICGDGIKEDPDCNGDPNKDSEASVD